LYREGISAGKNLATLQAELVPERFRSLYNQDFGKLFRGTVKRCWVFHQDNR
jgi:hypothetical protein